MSLQQCLNTILEYSLGNIGRPIKQSHSMFDLSHWTAYSLVATLVTVKVHAIYCHKGEKLKTTLRQNFGGTAKSIMVFLKKQKKKGLLQLNTKPTQRYRQPQWPIIRLAFPMSGDEYFAEPTRQQIERSTDSTLLDWLLEDAMVAFSYCCSHNIEDHFKWGKRQYHYYY